MAYTAWPGKYGPPRSQEAPRPRSRNAPFIVPTSTTVSPFFTVTWRVAGMPVQTSMRVPGSSRRRRGLVDTDHRKPLDSRDRQGASRFGRVIGKQVQYLRGPATVAGESSPSGARAPPLGKPGKVG